MVRFGARDGQGIPMGDPGGTQGGPKGDPGGTQPGSRKHPEDPEAPRGDPKYIKSASTIFRKK